ncbi:hypothetical protein N8590_01815 [bacterium]|jgi:hypothetical protein|nr:hypothetical protein [Planctomicrobium sp.]MDA7527705.1 hypothetical protein [bacterium]
MTHFTQHLLLADIEGFFGIVFFLIAFVGWVINLVSQNQGQNKQQRKRPANQAGNRRKQNVQNEIDQFLGQSRRNSGADRPQATDDVEVIAPPAGRRPPPRRRKTREEVWEEQTGAPPSPKPKPVPPKTKGRGLATRHLETKKKPKKELRKPKSISNLSEQVEKDLPHAVDASVTSHLHSFTAENPSATGQLGMASTTSNRKTKGSSLGKLLRSKSGVRNAIIMNEILSPPKSLRK